MQCEGFETRLNQILDRRLRPETDDHLLAHAQRCEACRELLAVQELLFDGLEMLDRPNPSTGFAKRLVAQAAPTRPGVSSLSSRWQVLAASVAALLLISVFTAPRLLPKKEGHVLAPPKSNKAVNGLPGTAALVNPGRPPRPEIKPVPAPAAPSSRALTDHDYRQMFEQFPQRFPEVQRDALEIPGGLRPIATSFGVAVGLIRRTLPGGKDEVVPPKPQAFHGEALSPIA